jgi:hypothetical protein
MVMVLALLRALLWFANELTFRQEHRQALPAPLTGGVVFPRRSGSANKAMLAMSLIAIRGTLTKPYRRIDGDMRPN